MLKAFLERRRIQKTFAGLVSPEVARQIADGSLPSPSLSEYKEYIQEDEALSRRFRTVSVCEPTLEESRRILYNIRPRLERNYSVRLMDDAIETALEMSPRYQRHLHMPDKVIGWLDTAAVRAEIDRRWEVTAGDVVDVISNAAVNSVDDRIELHGGKRGCWHLTRRR